MLSGKKPPQGIWGLVEKMLEKYGALNKKYDSNLDGVIDNADKVDGHYAGTGANQVLVLNSAGQVPLANIPLLPDSQLDFSFAWEKVAEVEASAAAQEIDVTGLAGDTDEFYLVLVALTPVSSTSNVSHFIIFNADTTIGNYEWTGFGVGSANGWGGSVQGFGATSGNPGLPFIQVYAGEIGGVGWALIHAKGVTVGTETYVTAVGLPGSLLHGWKISSCAWKKSAEVTEISLYCPAGSYIGEGTKMIVFKPKW